MKKCKDNQNLKFFEFLVMANFLYKTGFKFNTIHRVNIYKHKSKFNSDSIYLGEVNSEGREKG